MSNGLVMAARLKLWHPDIVRQRIKTSQLLNRLQKQAFDNIDISDKALKAIDILLKKTLPDLSRVEVKDSQQQHVGDLTTDELDRRIAALEGKAIPSPSQSEPTELH
jgi:hypothetical protein